MPKQHTERFNTKRKLKMKQMESRGIYRPEIGWRFGISRERVRQILGNSVATERQCLYCGETFISKQPQRKCCSKPCRNAWSYYHHEKREYATGIIQKISDNITAVSNDACWDWQRYCNPTTGYGLTGWQGKAIGVHRLMWKLVIGDIPEGVCVLHKCDNPRCVNPRHLFLGTHQDNARDRGNKGRWKGKRNFLLTEIRDIRSMYRSNADIPDLAERYGVHPTTIYKIVKGLAYKTT